MLIPKGILMDCCCVLLGTNVGSIIKERVPERIKQPMNVIFGISAMAIGMVSLIKLDTLPAVILALILGALIGEVVDLDRRIKTLFQTVLHKLRFQRKGWIKCLKCFSCVTAISAVRPWRNTSSRSGQPSEG